MLRIQAIVSAALFFAVGCSAACAGDFLPRATGGVTVAAAILAAAPFSLLLASHEVMDALPAALSRTGAAIAASLNLVPSVSASFG